MNALGTRWLPEAVYFKDRLVARGAVVARLTISLIGSFRRIRDKPSSLMPALSGLAAGAKDTANVPAADFMPPLPMITREFILSKPNAEIPIPVAARVTPAGYYPAADSITYDKHAKEHRIALTKLAWRN